MPYGESYKSGDVIGCYISLSSLKNNISSSTSSASSSTFSLSSSSSSSSLSSISNKKSNQSINSDRLVNDKSLSIKEINKDMLVKDTNELSLELLKHKSNKINSRKIIKYKRRLYAESDDYLPINLPLLVHYNLNSKTYSSSIQNDEEIDNEKEHNDKSSRPKSNIIFIYMYTCL